MSHPSRVRGLKPVEMMPNSNCRIVAPLAGAWIETQRAAPAWCCTSLVAPLAGAWIETNLSMRTNPHFGLSHPSRVRGLKLILYGQIDVISKVAPLAGAWIETWHHGCIPGFATLSHPSRVRGLKHRAGVAGLTVPVVAPLAGAWIETPYRTEKQLHLYTSHPSRVRGLKLIVFGIIKKNLNSRTPRGCVD